MDIGLSLGYMLLTVGTVQLMFGLVFIAGNAWKQSPALGIATAVIWPFTIYWALGKFKNDPTAPNPPLFLSLFFAGLIVMCLSFGMLYAFYEALAVMSVVGAA